QVNASIIVPTDIEIGYYTIETKYNDVIDTDYLIVTNIANNELINMYSDIYNVYVGKDETRDLNVYIRKTDEDMNLNWESNNTSIVSVTDGIITGLQKGSAIITVSNIEGSISDTINVTVNDVIIIDNYSQLNSIRNNLTGSYKLASDIDISAWSWNPIGDNANPFMGTFNGNGHYIKGIKVNKSTSDYNGLFGKISGASIKGLTLLNSNITGGNYTGTLAGYIELTDLTEISNVGGIVNGKKYTGGITGYILNSDIRRTFNTSDVTGIDSHTGGIAGYANIVSIINSYNNGNIEGIENVGGLFGKIFLSKIEKVFNTGDIHGTNYMVGGIIGYGEDFILTNAYNTGNILDSNASYISGIVGFGNTSEYKGSLISTTYNIGNIIGGSNYIGGIFGASSSGLIVKNNYDTSDSILAYGETGYASITNTVQKTISELKSQGTFVGFDFTNDWGINANQYPYLKSLPLLTDLIVNTEPLSLDIGEKVTIDIQFNPDTVLNKFALWESNDKNVVVVDNGQVTAIGSGNAVITITADGGNIVKNINVIVDSPISSSEYLIYGNYISEITNETLFEDFIENINIINQETTIKIYQSDGITECDTGVIGTNMILETTEEDKTIRFNIVVKGDVTGDGHIRVNDIIKINNHIIGYSTINNSSEILAADVTGDGNLRVTDIVKINNYIINPLTHPLIEREGD
ncbi:MAG: dockerin type I domain-containing protein, partial [Bacilli bacterium]|nr:dockerin type I domain-containing protein [Bacilli bacterium]